MIESPPSVRPAYPHKDTRAAIMLAGAIYRAKAEKGLPLRALASALDYKQPTILSHMANGRIPIPIRKAADLARVLDLPADEFLAAVVEQRGGTPMAVPSTRSPGSPMQYGFVNELSLIAGRPLEQLSDEQKLVAREVASDERPHRRWLSLAELPVMLLLRELRPEIATEGLSPRDRKAIERALAN